MDNIKFSDLILDGYSYSNLKFKNNKWEFEEKDLIEYTLKYLKDIKKPVLFDIGASIGDFALLPVIDNRIRCFSFEPNHILFKFLKAHIKLNNIQNNTKAYNYAICDMDGKVDLWIPDNINRLGLSCINKRRDFDIGQASYKMMVEGKKLDTIIKNLDIDKIDMLKIDVEGAELLVLEGASESIKKFKPLILIEVIENNLKKFNKTSKDLSNKLISYGYVFKEKIGEDDEIWINL